VAFPTPSGPANNSVCGTRYVTATVMASRPAAGKRIRASGYASITPSSSETTTTVAITTKVMVRSSAQPGQTTLRSSA